MGAAKRGFGFSGEDFLPGFGQLQSHQASADEGREGQEDGDDLGDADEGCKDEAGDDGGELANGVQDAERRPPAGSQKDEEGLDAVFHAYFSSTNDFLFLLTVNSFFSVRMKKK